MSSNQKNVVGSTSASSSPVIPRRSGVLLVIILSSFITSFAASSLNVAIPTIGNEFQISVSSLGWIISAYIICSVSLVLPLGRLGDITSRRTILIIGQGVMGLASFLLFFVDQWSQILALRVLQGVGAACLFTTIQAIAADVFPPEKRGMAIGLSVSFTYLGMSLGPVIGGFITHHIGWRWVFALMGILSLATTVLAIFMLPSKPRPADQRGFDYLRAHLDTLGVVFSCGAGFCLTFGLTSISRDWYAWLFVALGIVFLLAFIRHEKRAESPLVKPALFQNGPNFLLSNLSALLNYAATFAITYLISIYLQQIKGTGADFAGLLLITSPVVQTLLSPVAGRLSDRISPFKLASIGMAICTVSLILLCFIGVDTSLAVIVGLLAFVGFGFALFSSPNTNAIMSLAPREDFGIASSFVALMRNFGMIGGMAVVTITVNLFLGNSTVEAAPIVDLSNALRTCFIIFAIVCAIGVFTSLNRRSAKK